MNASTRIHHCKLFLNQAVQHSGLSQPQHTGQRITSGTPQSVLWPSTWVLPGHHRSPDKPGHCWLFHISVSLGGFDCGTSLCHWGCCRGFNFILHQICLVIQCFLSELYGLSSVSFPWMVCSFITIPFFGIICVNQEINTLPVLKLLWWHITTKRQTITSVEFVENGSQSTKS